MKPRVFTGRMSVLALALLLMTAAGSASACLVLAPDEQRRRDKEDIALQVQFAESLAREAEVVFIGRVTSIDDEPSVHVVVGRVLKGKAGKSMRLSLSLPVRDLRDLVISCWLSDRFHDGEVLAGRRYIFYVRDGKMLRAGWVERSSRDIALRDEKRIVLRARAD